MDHTILKCPYCMSDHAHTLCVETFFREDEDYHKGRHVEVSESHCFIDSDMTGNPSLRRNGVLITYECEMCQKNFGLAISHHKGSNFVEMRSL